MSKQVTIFVESDTDKQFLIRYLEFNKITFAPDNIKTLSEKDEKGRERGGKSKIKGLKNSFIKLKKTSTLLLLLDYDHQDCSHNQTCATYKQKGIITDYHLIGENLKLKKKSNLENLLLSTAKHTKFINCFAQYETCIEQDLPEKSKFFAYIDATANKRNDINYPEIFDLKHTNFEPLKNFLNSHLST